MGHPPLLKHTLKQGLAQVLDEVVAVVVAGQSRHGHKPEALVEAAVAVGVGAAQGRSEHPRSGGAAASCAAVA